MEKVGRHHQGMDRPGVRQVPQGSGEQGKMEKSGCETICGAPTTLAVKGLMMMMMIKPLRGSLGAAGPFSEDSQSSYRGGRYGLGLGDPSMWIVSQSNEEIVRHGLSGPAMWIVRLFELKGGPAMWIVSQVN